MITYPTFEEFFRALWGFDPFPWQSMLAGRVACSSWPQALDLPTATGKTACIDVALYSLAAQAVGGPDLRTAPRRVWFVVDRRIVVDEAYARARKIARRLAVARGGPLLAVAERLREIGGTRRPLAVARLRGGVFRDDGWARLPSQPAIITSTVDQLGSRLLFRGYGHSQLAAPIFAGLVAHDSLVLLDEAHCSIPFLQTMRSVATYRGWGEEPLQTPFSFALLSATPPTDIDPGAVFPGSQREAALDHPKLRQRLRDVKKRAGLVEVKEQKGSAEDPLVVEAVQRAAGYAHAGKRRVVAFANRIRTAEAVARGLTGKLAGHAEVVLLTGRMRPYERDRLVDRYKAWLRADAPEEPQVPLVVVSTQCLEVGADFSFDALVTEAASLDALRQRFGRLHRLGLATGVATHEQEEGNDAVILIRGGDADPMSAKPDPIYGAALAKTWKLLQERAQGQVIDFGVEALRATLDGVADLTPYLAPTADAPVLLPAHLDLLCQTAPRPATEPDISLFLHGKERGAPEVRVLWRADLPPNEPECWVNTLVACPPLSGEMLTVPLYRLRAFLANSDESDDSADLEGVPAPEADDLARIRPCLLWRGRRHSFVADDAGHIAPGDIVALPASYGIDGLGQKATAESVGKAGLDLWEPALRGSGRPLAARLNRDVLTPWLACPPVGALVALAESEAWDRTDLSDAVDAVCTYQTEDDDAPAAPPAWWISLLRRVRSGRAEIHPAGGLLLVTPASRNRSRIAERDLFADDDDLTSASGQDVSLDAHTALVAHTVAKLAGRCLPTNLSSVVALAADWHDAGKLDERFQILLHQGNELAALAALAAKAPLAKSTDVPGRHKRNALRDGTELPPGFRHEMLSTQLAERQASLCANSEDRNLLLHLIASHHGHARPFAPISIDSQAPPVSGCLGTVEISLSADQRTALIPAYRIDSGIADRFWHLTRRHGWWGLAYLEAIMRLADWYASSSVRTDATDGRRAP